MHSNHYQPPAQSDYANVAELNEAWLRVTTDLKPPQRARLATAPFLLFSLRETDVQWWETALGSAPQPDLLQSAASSDWRLRELQLAALAFSLAAGSAKPVRRAADLRREPGLVRTYRSRAVAATAAGNR